MNAKTIIFSLALGLAQNLNAANLLLSGTVPDRGVLIQNKDIERQENSQLKVYVKEIELSRGPQSVDGDDQKSKKWVKVEGHHKLAFSSLIKVVAP